MAPTTAFDGIFANLMSAFGFLLIAGALTFLTSAGFDGFLACAGLAVPGPLAATLAFTFWSSALAWAALETTGALTGFTVVLDLTGAPDGLTTVLAAVLTVVLEVASFGRDADLVGFGAPDDGF